MADCRIQDLSITLKRIESHKPPSRRFFYSLSFISSLYFSNPTFMFHSYLGPLATSSEGHKSHRGIRETQTTTE